MDSLLKVIPYAYTRRNPSPKALGCGIASVAIRLGLFYARARRSSTVAPRRILSK